MINEEFNLVDDSSESSEHANLPRVLILHETPGVFNSRKLNLAQSRKLTRSNDIVNRYIKKEEEKIDIGNNENKKKVITKYGNKELRIINLDDKLLFENDNFITNRKTMKYEKILLKTTQDMNSSGTENRRSCILKNQRMKLNKSNDFNNIKIKKKEYIPLKTVMFYLIIKW